MCRCQEHPIFVVDPFAAFWRVWLKQRLSVQIDHLFTLSTAKRFHSFCLTSQLAFLRWHRSRHSLLDPVLSRGPTRVQLETNCRWPPASTNPCAKLGRHLTRICRGLVEVINQPWSCGPCLPWRNSRSKSSKQSCFP